MPRASWSWNHCPRPGGISPSSWSPPVSRYKAGRLRQNGTRIKKPRKERAALRPCANRTASTWPGQAPLWILSAKRKDTPDPSHPGAEIAAGIGRPPQPICIPTRRFNNRADCSNERTSFNGAWSLPSLAETTVRPHPSGHPLTESARQCPAASTHSAGSSEQSTVLTNPLTL